MNAGQMRLLLVAAIWLTACTGGGDGGGSSEAIGEPIEAPGAGTVELTGPPPEGAGEVPTFAWTAVDGAASYHLVVLDADHATVWAWQGSGTGVALGGVPDRPAGSEGPVLPPGSSWSVAALDAAGHAIAVSPQRPVSP